MMQKIKDPLVNMVLRLSGHYSYINGEYMQLYLNEVRRDIGYLKEGMTQCKFERDQDLVFQHLVEKYEKDYCPSTFYRFFSFDNQLEYLYLRVEIDGILSRKNQFFSDF